MSNRPLALAAWRRGIRVRAFEAPRWQLTACSSMHLVNDGLFAGTYPLLPLVAADLGLSYAQVGAVKTAFTGASSILQVPAGMAAERVGEHLLLALGTGWLGLGLVAMALAPAYWALLAISIAGGTGGNVQHPVASAIVSRLFDSGRRATAIGTLNFAGDIGKVIAPIIAGGAAAVYGWRGGFASLGVLGVVFALAYLLTVPEPRPAVSSRPAPRRSAGRVTHGTPAEVAGWGIERPRLFATVVGIGVLDSATRGAALVFIPFLLQQKGADAASMSFYFATLFAAGAAGKFICGPLGDRFGDTAIIAITELVTAGALLGLLVVPLEWTLVALLPLGFVLNGTSSVLYASVAALVHASRRARGYGLYYTCSLVAAAAAPLVYGLVADWTSLATALVALAGATAAIVPLVLVAGRARG